ncbi:hypothetical protein C1O66_18425 [Paucibacter aquatile]|uniref:Uncharacterized protein n=1 Tax=Kinneretia aquatilis TaxID=2070761 RepID=A0A2N8L0T1_9BURK|nr:hypothetical protein [Paucibacter aquatile]PND39307.1 hypothetical protein C1O66_18425 [Paucibacter aquatile]WIV98404.1 hypothetical protein K9V56_002515 [Paucibacter aquatile]
MIDLPKLNKPEAGPAPRWFHIAVAGSMVLSSVAAIYGSWRTSQTMSALVKENTRLVMASSTPLLEFSSGNVTDGKPQLSFSVQNVGNGPARVVWFELKSDGKPVPHVAAMVDAVAPELQGKAYFTTATIAPRLISAGKEIRLFSWDRPVGSDTVSHDAWIRFDKHRQHKLSVQACYCSVLDACWISDLEGDIPKPVERCEAEGRLSPKG